MQTHKRWHNMGQFGGDLPKQYTANLSKKDKNKQIKAIKKLQDYKKENILHDQNLKVSNQKRVIGQESLKKNTVKM